MADNTLYFGDNLDMLRRYIEDESVDLIYLDPPFNSNQAYNVIFEEENGDEGNICSDGEEHNEDEDWTRLPVDTTIRWVKPRSSYEPRAGIV